MSFSDAEPTSNELMIFQAIPGNSIVLLPDAPHFTIIAATNDYCTTSGRSRQELINKGIFEAFPAPPDDPEQVGIQELRTSLYRVISQQSADRMPLVRYDIENRDGSFDERYWSAVNTPVIGDDGQTRYIIHTAEEMTHQVKAAHTADKIKSLQQSYNVFMQAPVTIGLVKGKDYDIEFANDSLLEVWGKTAEVIGKSLFEAIPELEAQGFRNLLDEVCRSEQPFYAYEFPIRLNRHGKEEVVYFDFVYKPYYEDGLKQPVGVLAVGHNVTKQVESRQKFKSVIEEATDPILILMGESLALDTANQALFDLWQVGPEALGKPFIEILPEMRGQGFEELLRNVLHTGTPFYGKETRAVFKRKNGSEETVYFDFSYQPYRNAEGHIEGVLVMAKDITAQVIARKKIEESEAELNELANAMPQLVWIANESGTVTYYNNQLSQFAGATKNAEGLWQWEGLVHTDDLQRTEAAWLAAIKAGSIYQVEHRIQMKGGEYRWHLSRGIPRKDADGKLIKWFGTATDIHEQKQFTEKLEKLVIDRTRALQQSNNDLQQFAHVASHDLKEPVRKIKTFASRLEIELKDVLNDESRIYLEKVQKATERMFTMIEGVLAYSTVNAGAESLQMVDLQELVQNIETDLEVLIQQTGTVVTCSNLPMIEGSPVLLYQLFYNLVNNAIKFAKPEVHPLIQISAAPVQVKGKAFTEIRISDNGIGFEQDHAEKIFETFTRLHPKDKFEGTGLGLSLCRKIVERHGGSIRAEGVPGAGARFIIQLPMLQTTGAV